MAIPCQGFTITWAGNLLHEMQALEIDSQRGLPIGRVTPWTPTFGTVRLSGFSATNIPESDYGRRRRLTISVPSSIGGAPLTLFDTDCIYEGRTVEAVANNVVRFAFVFTIQDTVNAPTNP